MANSAVLRFRIPPRLRRLIDSHRGQGSISAWLRAAASQRLEQEHGIDPPLRHLLEEHDRQLRGLGINLNQLAHAANEGRPVVVPQALLDEIDSRIRESRLLLSDLKTRLPD
ncbi:MAG: plasmid mobilization relaxosome protein MobC [Lamprobacter sp.]|uniref:plasmid mobilization relaxosome protein MobC n=1 Tax=Lamprobacter sp. TaxID=3100796 RepID=UPI002B25F608|nr:plasmid mobilization relaxosome protein MobC [Lamprobacter sp.]MEA3642139.1 plasmid mobilization relaxosome protein MobC [Lamprobacter sp.]